MMTFREICSGAKATIGDLARPFAMYSLSGATAAAIFMGKPADVIGAAGVIVAVIYGAKAAENAHQAKQDASVTIAQIQANVGQGPGT